MLYLHSYHYGELGEPALGPPNNRKAKPNAIELYINEEAGKKVVDSPSKLNYFMGRTGLAQGLYQARCNRAAGFMRQQAAKKFHFFIISSKLIKY